MAQDLSTKEKELAVIEAAISLAKNIQNTGEIPKDSDFAKNFPQFPQNDVLFILANFAGVRSKKELRERIGEVLERLTVLKKTVEVQTPGAEKIIVIPPAVEESPYFSQLTSDEVLAELEAGRLRIKAAQNSEFVQGFSLPETPPPTPSFYLAAHNPAETAPVFETPAKILLGQGLTSEDGVPSENYSEKLQDKDFKQRLEAEIKTAILQEHLENLLSQDLIREIEAREWAEKLRNSEKNLIANFLANDFAQFATPLVSKATPENLVQVQKQVNKELKDKFTKESQEFEEFLNAVFGQNPNFAEVNFRQTAVGQTKETILQTLANFTIENVKVELGIFQPKLTVSFYKLINGNLQKQELDYYILPKSPEELETDYNLAKSNFETLLKVAFAQIKTRQAASNGGGENGRT